MPRVLQFEQCGGPEVLSLTSVEPSTPVGNEVCFTVDAFALNQADILYIRGEHATPTMLPSRIGSEATGEVVAVGPDVTRFKVGDRVSSIPFLTNRYGVGGEFAVVPESYLALALEQLSVEENTAVWMQYLTAYFPFVHIAAIGSDDFVLIGAGASSAGIGAIQLAKAEGATVIATTRSPEKVDFIRQVGADYVLIDGVDNLEAALLDVTGGKGINLSYDPIGGRFIREYVGAMAKGAKLIHYGALADDADDLPMIELLRKAAVIYPYSMFNYVNEPELLNKAVEYVREKLQSGQFPPVIDRVFPFDEAIEAYHYMCSSRSRGKIVVRKSGVSVRQ